jgi:MFS family permease
LNSARRPEWVLAAAVAILLIAMGVRATFGLFLQPMSVEQGWTREVFSLAFAIQSIVWGIGAPVFGAMADRYGAGRTIVLGTLLYAAGLAGMAHAQSPSDLYWTAGVLCGLGQSGTTFGVVLGVVARNFSPARRSTALGIASAPMAQLAQPGPGTALRVEQGGSGRVLVIGLGSGQIAAR